MSSAHSLPRAKDAGNPNRAARRLVMIKTVGSILIVLHLLAVFIAPASVGPSSDLVRNTWSVMSPYLHATNLNFGYHFFAPEPSSTTLVEYTAVRPGGEQIHGYIPDRKTMYPRLLYHRYFMLTEYLGNTSANDPMRKVLVRTYANQIMKNHQATSVELIKVTHRLQPRERILLGADINDLDTFDREELGVFLWAQK